MKEILDFLTALKNNNNKPWMDNNRESYLKVKNLFQKLIAELIEKIAVFDPSVIGVQPKNCIFRLNRDIRFSKDKRPYKENFGAFISEQGKKGVAGGYYIHLQPGQHMLAGGSYMPPPDVLNKIRQEIDYNPDPLLGYMESETFKKLFGTLEGDKLKTAPKGYPSDHPHIDLINHKSFIVFHNLTDKQVLAPGFLDRAIVTFQAIKPLNNYIRNALS